jgi:hypothetical protein
MALTAFVVLVTCPMLPMYMEACTAQLLPNDSEQARSDMSALCEAVLQEPQVSLAQWA